ncbi:MAG: hypothetical protein ACR2MP_19190 [Streptosporangiaceae bacterium]
MADVRPGAALARPGRWPGEPGQDDDQAAALGKLIALAQETPAGPEAPAAGPESKPGPSDTWRPPPRPAQGRPVAEGRRPVEDKRAPPQPVPRRAGPGHPAYARPEPGEPAARWPSGWSVPARDHRIADRAAPGPRPMQSARPAAAPAAQRPRRGAAWALNDVAAARADGPEAWLADPGAAGLAGRSRELARGGAVDTALARAVVDIRRISGGMVEKVLPAGPVIAPGPQRRKLRKSTFGYVLRPATRVLVAVLSLGWAACVVSFWLWWLQPSHRITLMGQLLNSVLLVYVLCYPVFFIIAANRLRNIRPSVAVPLLRTAFVVTRAPSEPWDVACATLTAMLGQDFPLPYDVWLCDERPTAEIVEWCNGHGVMLASRNGVEDYHRETWPRRTKCKEGNLAYFYDYWGYRYYDVVAQLDCDHRPSRTYLAEMVRPFSDPAIGYVAAPSVCDANAPQSWSARGRLYREASFHGAFQLGHSDG